MATIFGNITGFTFYGGALVSAGTEVPANEYWVVFSNTQGFPTPNYQFRGGTIWWDTEGATVPLSGFAMKFSLVPAINAL